MRWLPVIWLPVIGLGVGVLLTPVATADVGTAATPYIDRAQWAQYGGLSSLRVYPTAAGRAVAGDFGKTEAATEQAWREVLALAAGADTAGMRAQFVCHWNFAEFAEPGKTSWDLEPWRPAVTNSTMVLSGCNPGGAEEQFG
jgi:hypothetical protein